MHFSFKFEKQKQKQEQKSFMAFLGHCSKNNKQVGFACRINCVTIKVRKE